VNVVLTDARVPTGCRHARGGMSLASGLAASTCIAMSRCPPNASGPACRRHRSGNRGIQGAVLLRGEGGWHGAARAGPGAGLGPLPATRARSPRGLAAAPRPPGPQAARGPSEGPARVTP
jgi:hypothetical protein